MGVLQQSAPPGQFVGFEKTASKPPAVTNEGKSVVIYITAANVSLCCSGIPSIVVGYINSNAPI